MPDKIQITIVRDCDAEGNGGKVVYDAGVAMQSLPDGTPLLDVILLAFAEQYPIPTTPAEKPEDPPIPTLTKEQHFGTRIRMFVNEVVDGWRAAKKTAMAAVITKQEDEHIQDSYIVIDNTKEP